MHHHQLTHDFMYWHGMPVSVTDSCTAGLGATDGAGVGAGAPLAVT